ncbi:MAG: 3-hydroxyacyl-CoA dehydrogenase [Betaproteobacteria bacterium]|jgi:NAD(P)-dependent dehydrogenase (short-subunit alcohol dehydrogenase family)|nr:3-hydroxyacyl-CoA dehydrogenase [Pseudomonadota bacterium]NBO04231.1 3-hydroxyacyl-CoA dehydrogenase [Betaproteobacteria bacterium]NBO94996.1 3-hydroxyacyl-CoA dehydrogenase [Betaproteobacteria bacterium]NBP35878.1 3-hydroxyacyl-CoA dehydrogenase [Betaproteobacteria bacterium]NBP37647.1 3-hydroxyacyl-CoA dehydrogenase [Betaproteobacteria bacterium]
MQIKGHVALITGGASGLGGASARMWVEQGGSVLIADVNAELGKALASSLGESARFVSCDVTSESDAQSAVDAAKAMGTVSCLINCAGIGKAMKTVGKDGAHPLDHFIRVVNVNLIGSFNMLRLAAAAMTSNSPNADGERGVIINTASVAAYDGQIGQAAYAASKAGIVGMTLPIARDLSRDGIRVVTIAPGLFETPLLAALPEEAKSSLGRQVPFPPRLGRPEEYAQMVRQIVENCMLNGETIRLDGAIRMAPR